MSDIFVSHVEEDADIALEITLELEEAGYSTWCYEIDSMPGPSYLVQTGEAIEASRAVVVVISPHSLGSRQVTNEIVRAHESGKEFIPVLRNISHAEFQNRQPEWREAVGAAASVRITRDGVAAILPRIITGLQTLNILPGEKAGTARISQIRGALAELQAESAPEKAEPPSVETPEPEPEPEPEPVIAPPAPVIAKEQAKVRKSWKKPLIIISSAVVVVVLVVVILITLRQPESEPTETASEPEPVILFSDDFESGNLDNWEIFKTDDGEISITDFHENLFMTSKNLAHATIGSHSWEDYEIKTRFAIQNGTGTVLFRRQIFTSSQGNLVRGYTLVLFQDRVAIRKGEGIEGVSGQSELLGSAPVEAFLPGKWYALAIVCRENRFTVTIDQEQVLSCEDTQDPVLSGAVSFGSLPDSWSIFDDIIIKTLITD